MDSDSRGTGDIGSSNPSGGGKQKVGHTTLNANNEPQKFKKLELENLQRSIQHAILRIISNKELYLPERQMLMVDLQQVVIINVNGSDVPREIDSSPSGRTTSAATSDRTDRSEGGVLAGAPSISALHRNSSTSVSSFRFKAYAPRAFDFFRKIYKVELTDFMTSIGDRMKCIPNPGASGSLFFITGDDCFIMKTLQKKEAVFLLELYPGYILNLYQSPDTLLPKYFGCYCYQSTMGQNVRIAIMNNLIPRNVTLWKKYDLKGSTYKRRTDLSKTSSKVPTLKDLNFREDFKDSRILLDSDIYEALIHRLDNDTLMLQSFQIMDYSFLMAIEEVDFEKERVATLRPDNDNVPSFYQYSEILNLPSLRNMKGIPATRESDGKHLRLYVGIIDILQKYVLKKKLEHRMKAVFLESHDAEVSVTHPAKFQRRFMDFMKSFVFKENKATPAQFLTQPTPISHHFPDRSIHINTPSKHRYAGSSNSSGIHSDNTSNQSNTFPPLNPDSTLSSPQEHQVTTVHIPIPTPTRTTFHKEHMQEVRGTYATSNSFAGVNSSPPGGVANLDTSGDSSGTLNTSNLSSQNVPQISPVTTNQNSELVHSTPKNSSSSTVESSVRQQRTTASYYSEDRTDVSGNDVVARERLTSNNITSLRSTSFVSPTLAKQESLSVFNNEIEDGYGEFVDPNTNGAKMLNSNVGITARSYETSQPAFGGQRVSYQLHHSRHNQAAKISVPKNVNLNPERKQVKHRDLSSNQSQGFKNLNTSLPEIVVVDDNYEASQSPMEVNIARLRKSSDNLACNKREREVNRDPSKRIPNYNTVNNSVIWL